MKTVLITGATGILGANICTQLIAKGGYKVRAVARDLDVPDVTALRDAGVEVVPGDVTDLASLQKAAEDADAVIHSAAMLGRPNSTWDGSWATNVVGTINILTAAAERNIPTVQVLTTTFFNTGDGPLKEDSPYDVFYSNKDMYSTTKRVAFAEGLARVGAGQDVRFMIPGAIYGPTICLEKGLMKSTFNDRIVMGIKGEMPPSLPLPMAWVSGEDCAYVCIAALEKGKAGQRYIAHGVNSEVGTMSKVLSQACEIAGSPHRVEEVPKDQLNTPEIFAKFGPTMPIMAMKTYPDPLVDTSFTERELGYKPTPLAKGLKETIEWMRSVGSI